MTLKLLFAGKDMTSFQPLRAAFDREDVLIISAISLALAVFLARKNQPDLIICEQQLIDGDGLSFFYETRNEPELSAIPFAFLLADRQEQEDILRLLRSHHLDNKVNFLFPENKLHKPEDILSWKNKILALLN